MTKPENTDHIWARAEIESPCIKICVIHSESRLCTGCLRSIDEISAWSRMTPENRKTVMSELPNRKIAQRRGGRKSKSSK
ncbi:DUF1289 domain-containing protein [Yoonia sp. 2307UL14-13]|uniref:DUF1289 domain-containing protein n=1 Tax=Yoonia sp. 2307UL14-13 TaxID=3126506 RepID=UPI0030A21F64